VRSYARTDYAPGAVPPAFTAALLHRDTWDGIAELALLVRRICKVVCKVAILDKKNPNNGSGF